MPQLYSAAAVVPAEFSVVIVNVVFVAAYVAVTVLLFLLINNMKVICRGHSEPRTMVWFDVYVDSFKIAHNIFQLKWLSLQN